LGRQRLFEGDVPSWIHCELCERRDVQRQELFVVAEDDEAHYTAFAESAALVLLCTDCLAIAEGAIDQLECSRRTNSAKHASALEPLPSDKRSAMPGA